MSDPKRDQAQKAMKVQMDIRNNADEVSSILGDLNKWEKKIARKDADMRARKAAAPPVRATRAGAGTVMTTATATNPPAPPVVVTPPVELKVGGRGKTSAVPAAPGSAEANARVEIQSRFPEALRADPGVLPQRPPGVPVPDLSEAQQRAFNATEAARLGGNVPLGAAKKSSSAAGHTYDVGYKKWESFDIDAAVAAADVGDEEQGGGGDIPEFDFTGTDADTAIDVSGSCSSRAQPQDEQEEPALTPASLANLVCSTPLVSAAAATVPKARGVHVDRDAETAQREAGNKEYGQGNFTAAVKSYTKCLGLKAHNYVAFSNRAMAYIKLKEHIRAEQDCNSALSINAAHTKSLMRRATARNALGKHRASLADLYAAQEITINDETSSTYTYAYTYVHRTVHTCFLSSLFFVFFVSCIPT